MRTVSVIAAILLAVTLLLLISYAAIINSRKDTYTRFMDYMKIQVLVGPIASGKSTYAANAAKLGWVVLNDDALVSAIHGGNYGLYDKRLKTLYKGCELSFVSLAAAQGLNIIIDRGVDQRQTSRRRWIGIANSLDVKCEAVVFRRELPIDHATRRYNSDSRGYPLDYWERVAIHHEANYTRPLLSEGFDTLYEINWKQIQQGVVYE